MLGRGQQFLPIAPSNAFIWKRQVPKRANPTDQDLVNELLARQDDAIGQLEKLEADILQTIELLSTTRREEEDGTSATDQSDTIKLPRPEQDTDRSSKAA